jgi:calcineurin-like phosphoesterase
METEGSLRRFLTGMPTRLEPAAGDLRLDGVVVDASPETGRALAIRRVQEQLREG